MTANTIATGIARCTVPALTHHLLVLSLLLPTGKPLADALPFTVRDHSNGMRSAYLSRPARADSLVALQFDVGSFQDIHGIDGLAHLAEHLLLRQHLPADKNNTQSLRDFLKSRGGRVQAKTGHQTTRFFFQISSRELPTLLNGLDHILRSPTFPPNTVAAEISAINDEFAFLNTKPEQLLWDALKVTTVAEHPFRRFSAGNLDSFAAHPLETIRAALADFYRRFYQASTLTTIVVASSPAAEQQTLIAQTLGNLPSTDVRTTSAPALFSADDMPQQLEIRFPTPQPQIVMLYPLHGVDRNEAERAIAWLDYWVESDRVGSWQQQLIDTQLVRQVTLGAGLSAGSAATLSLQIQPTAKGLRHIEQILATINEALQALITQSDGHALYRQFRLAPSSPLPIAIDNNDISLWFKQLSKHEQAKEPDGTFHFSDAFRHQIHLNNSLVVLLASTVEGHQKSPVFHVPFTHQRQRFRQQTPIKLSNFTPPQPLSDLPSLSALADRASKPALFLSTPALSAWHSPSDDKDSDVLVRLSMELPDWSNNVRSRSLRAVWLRALQTAASTDSASYWYQHDKGIGLSLRGKPNALKRRLRKLADELKQTVTESRFAQIKKSLIQEWQQPPRYRFAFEALVEDLKQAVIATYDSPQDRITQLQTLGLKSLRDLQNSALPARTTLYIYGSNHQTAKQLSASLEFPHHRAHELPQQFTSALRPGKPQVFSRHLASDANALLRYQQAPGSTPGDYAHLQVLLPMLRHQYFASLREAQQLAYGVTVVPVNLRNHEGIALIAQSGTTPPDKLQQATEDFLHDFTRWLNTVPDTQLEQLKVKALAELRNQRQPEETLRGDKLASHYWSQITQNRADGDWSRAVETSLEDLNRDQLTRYFLRLFDTETQRSLILKGKPKNQG